MTSSNILFLLNNKHRLKCQQQLLWVCEIKTSFSINFRPIGAEKGKRNPVRRESCFTPEIHGRLIGINFIYKPLLQKSRMLQVQGITGCSCSRLPQSLDNAGDAVSSAFPEGKQHGAKKPIIGNNRALYLDQSLKIATNPLFKLFYTNLTVLFMQGLR
jgi:hypothetical protein